MRRLDAVLVAALAALLTSASPARAQDDLPAVVSAALERAEVSRDSVVVMVQALGVAAPPRLAWRVDKPVAPASLMKLVTTYAGLELLGPAYRWRTPVWLQGAVHDGVLHGNLVIKGTGDPTLVFERLWRLLRQVRQLGVREIRGDIVLDRSAFTLPDQDPAAFDGQGLRPYNVQPDALMVDFKSVTLTFTPDIARRVARVSADPPLAGVRVDANVPLEGAPCGDWVGAVQADVTDAARVRFHGRYPVACGTQTWTFAYANPASYTRRALLGLWQEMGGRLGGVVREGRAPPTAPTLESTSPPLADVVRATDKYSNNVMAKQLFLTLGLVLRGDGSPASSRDLVQRWAAERFGQAAQPLVIDNGSGLSREAKVTALLLTRLLRLAWDGPWMAELMSALPITGIDGTLVDSTAAPGRAHLKTGTLRDVSGIAGYVLATSGRRYSVVAIANHANAPRARAAFETLVDWVVQDEPQAKVSAVGSAVSQDQGTAAAILWKLH